MNQATDTLDIRVDTLNNTQTGKSENKHHSVADTNHVSATDNLLSHTPDSAISASHIPTNTTTIDTTTEAAEQFRFDKTSGNDSTLLAEHWPLTYWGDTIQAPTSMYEELYTYGHPLSYNFFRDNWAMGSILVSFSILICIIATAYKHLKKQASDFFMPTNNRNKQKEVKTPAEIYTPIIASFVLCSNNGLLLFAAACNHYDFGMGIYPPHLLLGMSVASFALYYLLRWLLYGFTNWVFFEKSEKRTWKGGFAFLMTLECLFTYPIMLYAINTSYNLTTITTIFVFTYGLIRFFLLIHSYRIFFPKIYGLLHLFAYLCTLEFIPLLALWKILAYFSESLIVK